MLKAEEIIKEMNQRNILQKFANNNDFLFTESSSHLKWIGGNWIYRGLELMWKFPQDNWDLESDVQSDVTDSDFF